MTNLEFIWGVIIIIKNKEILFEGNYSSGPLKIWKFNNKLLFKRFKRINNESGLNGGLIWNDEYAIFSGYEKNIKIINIKAGKLVKNISKYEAQVSWAKKIGFPSFEKCLFSFRYNNNIYL